MPCSIPNIDIWLEGFGFFAKKYAPPPQKKKGVGKTSDTHFSHLFVCLSPYLYFIWPWKCLTRLHKIYRVRLSLTVPLVAARQKAAESRNYNSETMRKTLVDRFRQACNGKTPYDWQKDVTESTILVPGHSRNWRRQNLAVGDPIVDGRHKEEDGSCYLAIERTEEEQVRLLHRFDLACLSSAYSDQRKHLHRTTAKGSSDLSFLVDRCLMNDAGHRKQEVPSYYHLSRDVPGAPKVLTAVPIAQIQQDLYGLRSQRGTLYLTVGRKIPQDLQQCQQAAVLLPPVSPIPGCVSYFAAPRSFPSSTRPGCSDEDTIFVNLGKN